MVNILNLNGTLNEQAGPYRGQTVLEAENVVADLESSGCWSKVEDRQIDLAHSDRSKTPIEPLVTDQWFVKMERLCKRPSTPWSGGQVRIIPALRQGLRRLAQREARLADQPAALVGTPNSDLALQAGRGNRLEEAFAGRDDMVWRRDEATGNGSFAPERTWPRTPCPATALVRERTCSTRGSVRPSGRTRRSAGPTRRRN